MLITHCPIDLKLAFMLKPNDYFKLHLRYLMMIYLYFLRSLAHNYWNTLRNRMFPLHKEISSKIDSLSSLLSLERVPIASSYLLDKRALS